MDEAKALRIIRQHAETSRLFGVDFVPIKHRPVVTDQGHEILQEIGRKTIFGNPFRPAPGEELQGKTLEPYRKWLFAAILGEAWAISQYKDATGLDIPKDYARRILDIADMEWYCPGCKQRTCEDGVCHGSVLRKAAGWLKTPEGAKHVH